MTHKNGKHFVGKGAGVAAAIVAAAAAGNYFYGSKDAEKHRRIAAEWANNFMEDVMEKLKTLKNADQAAVMEMIDKAANFYHEARKAKREDILAADAELKQNWKELKKELLDLDKKFSPKKPSTKKK